MALLEEDQATLEQIITHLEGLFGENGMVPELRQILCPETAGGWQSHALCGGTPVSLEMTGRRRMHGIVQKSWIQATNCEGQFLAELKAGPVRSTLQEGIREQPNISHEIVVDTVSQEQKDGSNNQNL